MPPAKRNLLVIMSSAAADPTSGVSARQLKIHEGSMFLLVNWHGDDTFDATATDGVSTFIGTGEAPLFVTHWKDQIPL